jgi:hypothetical protein
MSFKELFEILPDIINLFVPGYVFLVTYKCFIESENKDFEVTAIDSIVLSYIFQLITELISFVFILSDLIYSIISTVLAFICSIIVVKIRLTTVFKSIFVKIGKTTGNKNIWYDFFDMNRGTRVRFYCKYNNENVTIIGDIKYFEETQDNECNFVVNDYEIEFKDGRIYKSTNEKNTMIFNTRNITGLEAHYGV